MTATTTEPAALDLEPYVGRILDADAHMQLPLRRMPELFGRIGQANNDMIYAALGDAAKESADPDAEAPHTLENIWQIKGARAPGAAGPDGRLATIDLMGVARQLVFPDPMICILCWSGVDGGAAALRRYNDLAAEWTTVGAGRLTAVGLLDVRDLDAACGEAHRLAKLGVRAVVVPEATPPSGLSPADPQVDRLWSILADADIAVTIHIGGGLDYTRTEVWGQTALLSTGGVGEGEAITPFSMGVLHQGAESYLVALTLGGVFERHPALRFGAIELGAGWFGPMAERLDMIVDTAMGKTMRQFSLRPSEYLKRSVRVTPFVTEDIGSMFERYDLDECYCFSTDFPHTEGSRDPLGRMGRSIAHLGSELHERFFVTNAELLLPT